MEAAGSIPLLSVRQPVCTFLHLPERRERGDTHTQISVISHDYTFYHSFNHVTAPPCDFPLENLNQRKGGTKGRGGGGEGGGDKRQRKWRIQEG